LHRSPPTARLAVARDAKIPCRWRRDASPNANSAVSRIWKGIATGPFWGAVEALDTNHNISAFGEDQNGELYVVALGGSIFRLAQAASPQVANCSVRPRVTIRSTRIGPGLLDVTLTATDTTSVTNNVLHNVAFNRIVNGSVTIGAQANQTSPFTVNLPPGSKSTRFTVQRNQGGQPVHVDFSATDRCGNWSTFVGGGANTP